MSPHRLFYRGACPKPKPTKAKLMVPNILGSGCSEKLLKFMTPLQKNSAETSYTHTQSCVSFQGGQDPSETHPLIPD